MHLARTKQHKNSKTQIFKKRIILSRNSLYRSHSFWVFCVSIFAFDGMLHQSCFCFSFESLLVKL
jgi:hypothetical protein